MLSVFLVEDDTTIARHVRVVLDRAHGMHCVGHAGSIDAALALLPRLQPRIVLTDMGLPDGEGTDLIRALRSGRCATPGWWPQVLAFSVSGDEARVLRAIEAGADGYLLKGRPSQELVQALESAARGEVPLSARVARHLLARVEAAEHSDSLAPPTSELLRLVAQGFMLEEVAARLHLSAPAASGLVRQTFVHLQRAGGLSQVTAAAARYS